MMSNERVNQPGVSFLDLESWGELMPVSCEKSLPDSFTGLPETFRNEVIRAISEITHSNINHLSPELKDQEYSEWLEQTFHLDRVNPNVPEALARHPQKTIAHALLAFAGLTEPESHVMPLNDIKSIIAHALYYYQKGLKPWFDFAVTNDYSSKNQKELKIKTPAPLFKSDQCPTFYDFIAQVVPKIYEIRSQDPQADIKIFPQTKNVETFNVVIHRNQDGTTTFTFEWYPGAYTPRDGEDGKMQVVKNRQVNKEERIVRAIVRFDKDGHALVGLKSQKDQNGNNLPFEFPTEIVDIHKLFERTEVIGNHDNMTSSNNPFIFLKYLATHPQLREILTKFQKVHAQLGYANLVLSGMIGPDTIFAMDMDYETPKNFANDGEYIAWCQKENNQLMPIPYSQLLDNIQHAPIFHELDMIALTRFYQDVATLFAYIDDPDDIDNKINVRTPILNLAMLFGMFEYKKRKNAKKVHLASAPLISKTPSPQPIQPNTLLSSREQAIVISAIQHKDGHRPFTVRPDLMQVLHARYPNYYSSLYQTMRTVASL